MFENAANYRSSRVSILSHLLETCIQSADFFTSAGVSGLTSALQLASQPGHSVTVVAKHMPGDYSANYASPWAGANFQP